MLAMRAAYDKYLAPVFDLISVAAELALKPFKLAWDAISAAFTFVWENVISPIFTLIGDAIDYVMDLLQPLLDGLSAVGDFIGGGLSAVGGLLGFSEGGVASGPDTGYPVMLHGTEAVVPLSGGRSIPVEMTGGGGGGGGNTFNITINPSGITDRTDKREMARSMGNMIQQEVARALGGTTMRGRM